MAKKITAKQRAAAVKQSQQFVAGIEPHLIILDMAEEIEQLKEEVLLLKTAALDEANRLFAVNRSILEEREKQYIELPPDADTEGKFRSWFNEKIASVECHDIGIGMITMGEETLQRIMAAWPEFTEVLNSWGGLEVATMEKIEPSIQFCAKKPPHDCQLGMEVSLQRFEHEHTDS